MLTNQWSVVFVILCAVVTNKFLVKPAFLLLSLQRDICLLHEIEDEVANRFDAYECDDKEVTKDITKVCYFVD